MFYVLSCLLVKMTCWPVMPIKILNLESCVDCVDVSDINSLRPRRNRHHFTENIFKCLFLNKNEWIPLRISLKFVLKVRINNIPSLVQIMAWRRPGDKPLSELMMFNLLMHVCITPLQWVKCPIMTGLLYQACPQAVCTPWHTNPVFSISPYSTPTMACRHICHAAAHFHL